MVNKGSNYSTFWDKNKLHNDAEIAREEEKYDEALKLIKKAIIAYKKTKNYKGTIAAIQTRCLIFKHLFLLFKKDFYLKLAKEDIEKCFNLIQKHNLFETLSSCYFRL